jgi:polyhydroxybutyrate depolymerase
MDIRVELFRRSYLVHLPPRAAAGKPLPLVVVIHGAFDTGKRMEALTGWSRIADREGFVVAYPNGMGLFSLFRHWNAGHCCGRAHASGVDDVAFLEAVIADIQGRFSIDPARIYLMGNSNGGMLTHHLAARHAGRFAAAAVVSGTIGGRPDAGSDVWQVPQPAVPLPIMLFHGRDDDIIPFAGGDDPRDRDGRTHFSVADSARFWAAANGVSGEPETAELHGGRVAFSRWGGADDAPVLLYAIDDWGHVWPGERTIDTERSPELAGFDAAELAWNFFRGHTRTPDRR